MFAQVAVSTFGAALATVNVIVYCLVVVPSSAVTLIIALPGKALACVMATVALLSVAVAATVGTAVVPAGNSTS